MRTSINGQQSQETWTHCKDNLLSVTWLYDFYCFKHHFIVFFLKMFYKSCGIFRLFFIIASIFIMSVKPTSAWWDFNVALQEVQHLNISESFWKNHERMKHNFESLQLWWANGKMKIHLCQQYTRDVTKTLTSSINFFETEVKTQYGYKMSKVTRVM